MNNLRGCTAILSVEEKTFVTAQAIVVKLARCKKTSHHTIDLHRNRRYDLTSEVETTMQFDYGHAHDDCLCLTALQLLAPQRERMRERISFPYDPT